VKTLRGTVLVLSLAVLSACAPHVKAGLPSPSHSAPIVVPALPALARATPPTKLNPDPAHPTGLLIEVSIARQRLTVWNDGRAVLRTLISTGRPGYETPSGHFFVLHKSQKAWSKKWGVWMPWALNIYGNYFIHQLPHYPDSKVNIGASSLGKPASHGCVRVGIPAAERLYRRARIGTPVWIH
jgi:lipoprotein-anchoring transpeptidase ErfK/SrfK